MNHPDEVSISHLPPDPHRSFIVILPMSGRFDKCLTAQLICHRVSLAPGRRWSTLSRCLPQPNPHVERYRGRARVWAVSIAVTVPRVRVALTLSKFTAELRRGASR